MSRIVRSYRQLRRFETLEERYKYLALKGTVGQSTFGFDRWVNQRFYTSKQWRDIRSEVIVRDDGCDLGIPGYEIHKGLSIHHMNPMTLEDIESGVADILNPDFLISVSHRTHNAIHYGDESLLPRPPIVRTSGDTKLW
jgi:hypothetical protein